MGGPFPSFSEEQVQVVTMAVPINLAFPLLPSFAVIINNPVRAESEVIVMVGSDGIVGLIRVSVGN